MVASPYSSGRSIVIPTKYYRVIIYSVIIIPTEGDLLPSTHVVMILGYSLAHKFDYSLIHSNFRYRNNLPSTRGTGLTL